MSLPRAFLILLAATLLSSAAHSAVVERVVAIVGERAIFLSDLKDRAKPFLLRVYQDVPEGAQRSAAISQIYGTVLERMIDEELEQKAAARSQVAVSAAEVTEALERVATQNGISATELLQEAQRTGLSAADYREELRRQLLQAKLLNVRLQGRIRVTEDDVRTAYRKLEAEERRRLAFRGAQIALALPSGEREQGKVRELAESLAVKARMGADFSELVRTHSVDPASRQTGGLLPRQTPAQLPAPLQRSVIGLEPGGVTSPIQVGNQLVIFKLVERDPQQLPPYNQLRVQLHERVYLEKMNTARRHWLDGLRRRTHVEVRL